MIPYTVIRSKRKTLCIRIEKDASVTVRVPLRCSIKRIHDFVKSSEQWILENQEKVRRRVPEKEFSPEEVEALKAKAREVLPSKLAYYAKLMGVTPTGMKITSAKTRFGSCNWENSICFSYILMTYPDACIDYVVVHELAHIKEHNHSPAFYDVVRKVMPDYKERERILKGKAPKP